MDRDVKSVEPEALSRRGFLLLTAGGTALGATSLWFATAGPAAAHHWEDVPVDLGRSVRERVLDATIDISAETGFVSVTAPLVARRAGVSVREVNRISANFGDYVAATMNRLFERRIQTYYANAALIDSASTDAIPGLEAMARQFPDPVWIAYWDILFAIRGRAEIQKKVQQVTTVYDNKFIEIVPKFFPKGVPEDEIWFTLLHFDGLGLISLTTAGAVSRSPQVHVLESILETN